MTSWTSGQEKLSKTAGSSASFRSVIILVIWQIRTMTLHSTWVREAREWITFLRMRTKRTEKTGPTWKKLTRFLRPTALLPPKSPDSCHSGLLLALQTRMTWTNSSKQRRSDANSMAEMILLKMNSTFFPHGQPPLGGRHSLPGPNPDDPRP